MKPIFRISTRSSPHSSTSFRWKRLLSVRTWKPRNISLLWRLTSFYSLGTDIKNIARTLLEKFTRENKRDLRGYRYLQLCLSIHIPHDKLHILKHCAGLIAFKVSSHIIKAVKFILWRIHVRFSGVSTHIIQNIYTIHTTMYYQQG